MGIRDTAGLETHGGTRLETRIKEFGSAASVILYGMARSEGDPRYKGHGRILWAHCWRAARHRELVGQDPKNNELSLGQTTRCESTGRSL